MLGKFHRTSETAYKQRSALPNRVMPAATRLTQFAAVSDLACRCGNSRQMMDELAPQYVNSFTAPLQSESGRR